MRGTRYKGRSKEWYLAKALAAINGAAGKEWSVRIVHHIVLRSGEAHIDGHVAVLSYCSGIFAFPVHAFSPEESSVLRAQKIYCDMVRKFGNAPKTNKGGAHG